MENQYGKIYHTARVGRMWFLKITTEVQQVIESYPDILAEELPWENFRVLANGDGEIYVKIRDREIAMRVPKEEWSWKWEHMNRLAGAEPVLEQKEC